MRSSRSNRSRSDNNKLSLNSIKFEVAWARYALILLAVVAAVTAVYQARLDLAASAAYQGLAPRNPDSRLLAEWMIAAAPDDPYVRLATAHYYEKTFESNDLQKALAEFERAAALSPDHYGVWLQLGAARDREGDDAGAEAAYRRALELAPNYTSVSWAYGNSLLRHGNTEHGFQLIAKAAASDPNYSAPAVSTALHFFDGSPEDVRRVLGSNASTNASLTLILATQKKWDAAYDAWSRIPADARANYRDIGNWVVKSAADARQTRIAASIYGDLMGPSVSLPAVGNVTNGGFEDGVKLRNAGIFDWQIAEGTEPQIGLSEGVKKSGRYSMSITFDSFEASEFRTISQRVPVEPGASYEFEFFYRADIKSRANFKWDVIDLDQNVLATTDALSNNGDWASLRTRFTVPAQMDGVVIRFVRSGCGTAGACPVTGKIFFDDLSLKRP